MADHDDNLGSSVEIDVSQAKNALSGAGSASGQSSLDAETVRQAQRQSAIDVAALKRQVAENQAAQAQATRDAARAKLQRIQDAMMPSWNAEEANKRAAERGALSDQYETTRAQRIAQASGQDLSGAPTINEVWGDAAWKNQQAAGAAEQTRQSVNASRDVDESQRDIDYGPVGAGRETWGDTDIRQPSSWFDRARTYLQDRYAAPEGSGASQGPAYLNDDAYAGMDPREAAQKYKASLREDLENQYAADGRPHQIGGEGFQRELSEAEVAAGLREAEPTGFGKALHNLTHDTTGLAFGFGYSAMNFGSGISQIYSKEGSGQYVSPEEARSLSANAILPGAGGLLGTVLGTAVGGPAGGLAGQFIGQSGGQVISSIIGASDQRAQAVRQTGEQFGDATGASEQAIRDFTSALQRGTAAVDEIQKAMGTLARTGTGIGSGTLSNVSGLSQALGERFNPAFSTVAAGISQNPFLRPLTSQFSGNGLSASQYGDLAVGFAANGDLGGADAAQTLQTGKLTNPQWAADKGMVRDGLVATLMDPKTMWKLSTDSDFRQQYKDARLRLVAGEPEFVGGADAQRAATAAGVQETFGLYTQSSEAQAQASGSIGLLRTGLALDEAQGASDDTLAGKAQGIYRSANQNSSALTRAASAIDDYIRQHPGLDDAARQSLHNTSLADRTASAGLQADAAGVRRSIFGRQLETETSGFGFEDTQNVINGVSAEDRQWARHRQADFLNGTADNPQNPLSPSERNQLRLQSAVMRDSADRAVDTERLGNLDTAAQRASAGIAQAQGFGGLGDVYRAQGSEVEALRAKLSELTAEIDRGGMSVADMTARQREAAQTTQQIAQALAGQRRDYYAGLTGIDEASYGAASADLTRQVAIKGNSAYSGILGQLQDKNISDLQSAFGAAPAGSQEQADAAQKLAQAQAAREQFTTQQQTFQPGVADRERLASAQFGYALAKDRPYQDGPDSNPFTRGRALEADLNREAGQYDKAASAATDPLAKEADLAGARQDRLQAAGLDRDRLTAIFGALPEMVAGSPGRGIESAVIPPAALSALFDGGNAFTGSWGGADTGDDGPASQGGTGLGEGGVFGAFSRGGGSGPGGGAGAAAAAQTNAILSAILSALEHMDRPISPGAPQNSSGAANRDHWLALDPISRQ